MPDQRRHEHWHGRGPPRGRPPWWPENEVWPPAAREGWDGIRRYFLRRVAFFFVAFFAVMFAANALAFFFFSEGRAHRPLFPVFAVIGVVLVVGFIAAGRAVRRMAGPIGDVMDAAERVAGGDYGARVAERGPREVRRLARSFNAMTERLHANDEQRRNLLADLAHELRTPLSVIRGNAEGMLDGVYSADASRLAVIVDETKVMSRLLDDLRTLATAEAGALRLDRERVEASEMVDEAIAAFAPAAESAGVALERNVAAELPTLSVDRVRIAEVLANLLQNALRHTRRGGRVVVRAEPAPNGGVMFAVEDTGDGIPPEDLPHVFDRFVKAVDTGGAGLGLAIAKSLVEAHDGTISAASERGKGTTIRFVLPASGASGLRP